MSRSPVGPIVLAAAVSRLINRTRPINYPHTRAAGGGIQLAQRLSVAQAPSPVRFQAERPRLAGRWPCFGGLEGGRLRPPCVSSDALAFPRCLWCSGLGLVLAARPLWAPAACGGLLGCGRAFLGAAWLLAARAVDSFAACAVPPDERLAAVDYKGLGKGRPRHCTTGHLCGILA